jgi:aldose 1-epimerase
LYQTLERQEAEATFIDLISSDKKSSATICLNQGARLSNFIFNQTKILANFDLASYKSNYASAILFPFPNRIEDGTYIHNGIAYKLNCNDIDNNNAIHGLVYDKTFNCNYKNCTADSAMVKLNYKDEGKNKGFPFKYALELTYVLNNFGLQLEITVVNLDKLDFPFALGWHPYFTSKDLNKSVLQFNSNKKYLFDERKNLINELTIKEMSSLRLHNLNLDDCFYLNANEVEFITEDYILKLKSTSKENFLQLYTPGTENTIAIEPMTAAVNSFNNKIGLQILGENESYTVNWQLVIVNTN